MPTLLELTSEHRDFLLRHGAAWDIAGESCFSFAAQRRFADEVVQRYNGFPMDAAGDRCFPHVVWRGQSPLHLCLKASPPAVLPYSHLVALHHEEAFADAQEAERWLLRQMRPFIGDFRVNERRACGEALRAVLWVADHYSEWEAMVGAFNAAVRAIEVKDASVAVLTREIAAAKLTGKLLRTERRDKTYPRLVAYYRERLHALGEDPDALPADLPEVVEMVG